MRAYGVANTTLGNEHVMMRRKIVSALMEFTINNMQGTGKKIRIHTFMRECLTVISEENQTK